jgi:hypothetical protein
MTFERKIVMGLDDTKAVTMECFWCAHERVEQQRFDKGRKVVTQYQGTPLCAIHAHALAVALESEKRLETESPIASGRKRRAPAGRVA